MARTRACNLPKNQLISNFKQDKIISNSGRKKKNGRGPLKCPILSIEKGTEITQAIAPELVSLDGNKDVVLHQILDGSRPGDLFVSAQLTIKLPLPARGGGNAALFVVFLLCWFGLFMWGSSDDLLWLWWSTAQLEDGLGQHVDNSVCTHLPLLSESPTYLHWRPGKLSVLRDYWVSPQSRHTLHCCESHCFPL